MQKRGRKLGRVKDHVATPNRLRNYANAILLFQSWVVGGGVAPALDFARLDEQPAGTSENCGKAEEKRAAAGNRIKLATASFREHKE